jgi:hypothetical protein
MVGIESSLYHKFLRVAALTLALILLFDSGLVSPVTERLSTNAGLHVANVVGVSVGVAPNEVNQLTSRITELETELEAKERLIAVNVQQSSNQPFDTSTFVLSTILFVLLLLIILNYILDYNRSRKLNLT